MLAVLAAPVMAFVLVFAAYALIVWRHREGDDEDGPPIQGNAGIQATWITVTAVIVLFLAGFGTYELASARVRRGWRGRGSEPRSGRRTGRRCRSRSSASSGGSLTGTRSSAASRPRRWSCRSNEPVQFNVTSLDVIHSFWAYQLGVKADANPGVNNIAFTTAKQLGSVTVRCEELCGLWHGAMFNYGQVVSVAAFQGLGGARREAQLAPVTAILPPYATTYDPTVVAQINKAMVKAGIAGGNGYYYPPQRPGAAVTCPASVRSRRSDEEVT